MKAPSYGKISSQTLMSATDLKAIKDRDLHKSLGKAVNTLTNNNS